MPIIYDYSAKGRIIKI